MKKSTDQDDVMIRYLLGDATEEEQDRLEARFFADDEHYQQLLALEDELKYEYAQGGLTSQQRQRFEQRFLSTEADREKVALAREVLANARAVSAETMALASAPAGESTWWDKISGFFLLPAPGMRLAFNAAAVVVLAGGVWFMVQTFQLRNQLGQLQAQKNAEDQRTGQQLAAVRTQQNQLNQQLNQERSRRSELEQQIAKRLTSTNFLSFMLAPGLTRDIEGPKRLLVPADSGSIRLQLELKPDARYRRYRAEIQNLDGVQVWSGSVAQAVLDIPSRVLPPGDYVVALKGVAPDGDLTDLGEYYFEVVRN